VTDKETSTTGSASAATASAARKATTRRKRPARRKPAARKKTASRARSRRTVTLESLVARLSRQAARTGSRIASISEEGISSARRTLGKAGAASKKTIGRLTREWKQMDTRKRAQLLAAVLGALAAASAPIVRGRLKKK